ncbi:hypothetical protein A2686_03055 [Candidatus Woesebacteria bacterium RIFCSPHIGHO2_01_FULL_38_10]|uniref:Mur ligase central domain-containing protein n=1 Tax=Candidatus Woesebacteria bacterium RIFCSPLOWO2_01_FULL_39_10b TaxID=1802517 RepID=A0A1F8B7C4_9BACT|nr:MAG: hypothetical protein A2686_03055 [Candidatus Woesebacteria bacterium RIFCSPHIGHO2_01_FULL_38_10]OGM59315.1 MAG: hypothetical protein A2892_05645 [Candidatus Woesebacteria bacterium RIFCSPLOWO2_01_FULL_39_10b]
MEYQFKLIILTIWIPQAIRQLTSWIYWLQLKEYRFDRFKILFKGKDGRKNLFFELILLKLGLIVFAVSYFKQIFLPSLIFLLLDLILFWDLFKKRLKKPVITKRIINIFLISLALFLIAIYLFWDRGIFSFIFVLELTLLLAPLFGVLITQLISNRVKKREIEKAKKLLQKVKPLVIGVTGSYGKTTTKEFIAQLLSQKYKVAKTPTSQNTEFGIIRSIFANLRKDTEILVVEMGAYKKGEIESICKIVKPEIGVVTGIEPQHLELFGSLENIKKAKYELIESLPKKGMALFNLTNKLCFELFQKAKKAKKDLKVFGYYLENPFHSPSQKTTIVRSWVNAKNIVLRRDFAPDEAMHHTVLPEASGEDTSSISSGELHKDGISESNIYLSFEGIKAKFISMDSSGLVFETKLSNSKTVNRLSVPFLAGHFLENLLAAIYLARKLGVSWSNIEKGCKSLRLPEKTMNLSRLKNGNIVIDDTLNSTPKGFESALTFLAFVKRKKKIIFTTGIIELGEFSDRVHRNLGKMMKRIASKVILRNKDFERSIRNGLGERSGILVVIDDIDKLTREFLTLTQEPDSAILLEGKLPQALTEKLGSLRK